MSRFSAFYWLLGIVIITTTACNNDDFDVPVEIPDFDYPSSVQFADSLSSYAIFEGDWSALIPKAGVELLELSAPLFTDYAHKQRLVRLPEGTSMEIDGDGEIIFPDGTLLTKTFFYFLDERNPDLGKRIIETRLEIKQAGIWNVATYLWNDEQDEALLTISGHDTPIEWINESGQSISTLYHVPDENECIACHQSNGSMSPIGPKLRNLNRAVNRAGHTINQLNYLQEKGLLANFDISTVSTIVDYNQVQFTVADRARAYLDMNCAHCHNPSGWETPAELDFDFRYETPLAQTGIVYETEKIVDALTAGEMPFIGTTLMDNEGVALLLEYFDSL